MYKDINKTSEAVVSRYDFTPNRMKFERLLKSKSKKHRLYRNLYVSMNSFSSERKSFREEKPGSEVGIRFKNNFMKIKERLEGVKIHNEDFSKIIKKYDSPDTFFYLDPPYSQEKSNWGYNHTTNPQEVYDTLQNIKGKFLLSYDDSKQVKKIFSKYNIYKVKTTYKINIFDKKNVTELLISNYKL